jgi:catalase
MSKKRLTVVASAQKRGLMRLQEAWLLEKPAHFVHEASPNAACPPKASARRHI